MAAADTLHWRIKKHALEVLRDLNLEEIGTRVVGQMESDEVALPKLPCVVVTTEGETEEILDSTTLHLDRRYPLRVLLLDRDAGRRHEREPRYLDWRTRIIGAFEDRHRPFRSEVAEVYRIGIRPEPIFDPNQRQYALVVSALVLLFDCRVRKPVEA
jgi:hypothetical protein